MKRGSSSMQKREKLRFCFGQNLTGNLLTKKVSLSTGGKQVEIKNRNRERSSRTMVGWGRVKSQRGAQGKRILPDEGRSQVKEKGDWGRRREKTPLLFREGSSR